VRTVSDAVLASLAYNLDGIYHSNGQSTFVVVYNIGPSSIEVGIVEVEEGVFEVLSTSEDKSINDDLFHSELVDHVRKLYPDLRDVETSLVSVQVNPPNCRSLLKVFLITIKLDKEMERVRIILSSEDTAQFTMVLPNTGQVFGGTVTQKDFVRPNGSSIHLTEVSP
jgi:molecular chaperone DnaK (HSP70)